MVYRQHRAVMSGRAFAPVKLILVAVACGAPLNPLTAFAHHMAMTETVFPAEALLLIGGRIGPRTGAALAAVLRERAGAVCDARGGGVSRRAQSFPAVFVAQGTDTLGKAFVRVAPVAAMIALAGLLTTYALTFRLLALIAVAHGVALASPGATGAAAPAQS